MDGYHKIELDTKGEGLPLGMGDDRIASLPPRVALPPLSVVHMQVPAGLVVRISAGKQ